MIEFITRPDCSLCAAGRVLVDRWARRLRVEVVERDVGEPGLEPYAERIPVVRTGRGRVIDEGRLSPFRLAVWLTAVKVGAGRPGR